MSARSGVEGALPGTLRRAWRAFRPPRLAGGLVLARDKPGLEQPILELPLPAVLVLPLLAHGAHVPEPLVALGRRVARGETLAPGVLASADGTVVAIEPRPVAHASGLDIPCIVIETDGRDATSGLSNTAGNTNGMYAQRIGDGAGDATPCAMLPALERLSLERLVECGVSGLGGAGFPTAAKFASAVDGGSVHTLVVNGAECEPGIACDEALMRIAAIEIVQGALALAALAGCRRCLLVVEADKRATREALLEAIAARADTSASGSSTASTSTTNNATTRTGVSTGSETEGAKEVALSLVDVRPLYPSGAERLAIRLATGIDVPAGERPASHGVLCVNVATARAAHRARHGEPLVSRIVTVGGARASRPRNVRVLFGTPLAHVLDASGQGRRAPDTRLRVGGPLSGFDVASESVPLTATTNRVALEPPRTAVPVAPCIRCSACSEVCPVGLLPQELLRHARVDDQRGLDRHALDACLECGCCDIVCPSSIPLTETFRHARGSRLDARVREHDALAAETRHRARVVRLARRAAGTIARPAAPSPSPSSSPATATGSFRRRTTSDTVRTSLQADPESEIDDTVLNAKSDVGGAGRASGAEGPGGVHATDVVPVVDPVAAALARVRQRRGGGGR